jgi:hypothetical protein
MIPVNDPELLTYYTEEVVNMISEKYGFEYMDALIKFWSSDVYQMMKDPELVMIEFSALAIFDMWESEKVTGDPRNSVYLRS